MPSRWLTPEYLQLRNLYYNSKPNAHLTSGIEKWLKDYVEGVEKHVAVLQAPKTQKIDPIKEPDIEKMREGMKTAKCLQNPGETMRLDVVEISDAARPKYSVVNKGWGYRIDSEGYYYNEKGQRMVLDSNGNMCVAGKRDPVQTRYRESQLIRLVESARSYERKGKKGYVEWYKHEEASYRAKVEEYRKYDMELYVCHLIKNKYRIAAGNAYGAGLPADYTLEDYYREIKPFLNDNPHSIFYRKNV